MLSRSLNTRAIYGVLSAGLIVGQAAIVPPSGWSQELSLRTYELVTSTGPNKGQISVHPDVMDADRRAQQLFQSDPSLKGKFEWRELESPALQVLDKDLQTTKVFPLSRLGHSASVESLLFSSTGTERPLVYREAKVSQDRQQGILIERRDEPDGDHGEATGAIGLVDNTGKVLWKQQLPRNMNFSDVKIDARGERVFALGVWTFGVRGAQEQLRVFNNKGELVFSFPSEDEERYRYRELAVSDNGRFVGILGSFDRSSVISFFDVEQRLQWDMPWSGTLGDVNDSGVYTQTEVFLSPSFPRTIDLTEKLAPRAGDTPADTVRAHPKLELAARLDGPRTKIFYSLTNIGEETAVIGIMSCSLMDNWSIDSPSAELLWPGYLGCDKDVCNPHKIQPKKSLRGELLVREHRVAGKRAPYRLRLKSCDHFYRHGAGTMVILSNPL